MRNRRRCGKTYLSVCGVLVTAILLPMASSAQLPTFEEIQSTPTFGETRSINPGYLNPSSLNPSSLNPGYLNPSYKLGPGDEIRLNVLDYEEFSNLIYTIMPDGTIQVPLIGSVIVANRTISELTGNLTSRLKPWLKNPVVVVSITRFRPLLINVAGEVQRPGPIQLNSFTSATANPITSNIVNPNGLGFVQLPTLSVAIIAAGGLTRDADVRQVVINRFNPNGVPSTVVINLWDSLFSERASRELIVQDGDSIFIPKLAPGDSIDRKLVARSSLAPRTVRVRVVGEVKKPGEIDVIPDSSLSSAIAIAGGPTDKAKLSEVIFVRLKEDGTVEEQTLDLSNLSDTNQVQQGDVLIVPKSHTSNVLDFANVLVNPLNFLLNLFK